MPGTYSQILLHVVFATKNRERWITPAIARRLYAFIGGVVRAEGAVLRMIGGVEDHVHLLIGLPPSLAISELMRNVKSRSSRFVRTHFAEMRDFAWQEGFGAFSVSASMEAVVRRYIARQPEHHATESSQSELRRLLRRHGVAFDDRYVD